MISDTEDTASGAFTRFFERHYDDVRRYALRRLGPDAADDVAAETFDIAWRRFDRLPKDQPLPWLYGVARNVVHAHRRSAGRRNEVPIHSPLSDGPGARTPDPTNGVAERDLAVRALGELRAADRELLMLLAWEGLELREAAKVLGCTTATARVRLHRARRRLERLLDHPPPDAGSAAPARVALEEKR
jgi:RNA polymerase sigma-70 factor (ECF subfamily)